MRVLSLGGNSFFKTLTEVLDGGQKKVPLASLPIKLGDGELYLVQDVQIIARGENKMITHFIQMSYDHLQLITLSLAHFYIPLSRSDTAQVPD